MSVAPERFERMARLRRVPMLASLTDADLAGLVACLRWRDLRTGDVLYRQGEAGDTMAFVVSGALNARIHLKRGGEYEIGPVAAGSLVGEMACIDPATRSATVVALEPSTVAEIGRDALTNGLRAGSPAAYSTIVRGVARIVAERLRVLDERIDAEIHDTGPSVPAPAPVRVSTNPSSPSSLPRTFPSTNPSPPFGMQRVRPSSNPSPPAGMPRVQPSTNPTPPAGMPRVRPSTPPPPGPLPPVRPGSHGPPPPIIATDRAGFRGLVDKLLGKS